jgi:hypothetical protein
MIIQIERKLLLGEALTADEQAWLDGMIERLQSWADEAMAFVQRAVATFADAVRPLVQSVMDVCWSAYLADGAIYGLSTSGMVAWWHDVRQIQDDDYYMRN